ncbi:filamentous hemagglutinin N-terminal domain-containing protein [Nostoc sp. CHAB 5836]|uniref:two-partner secretion domain-containing protein n=1 Tax=Nostoc sp. CHAB 5836 TaxID=2780404 RepID=UPI001E4F6641|nr:filamentous hemagglutinin N-terminal domain-containing protein [Nostoc sp. CHAB 5836]MCC5618691.1 filamentous hemagglutinin N-terminal domain-containing protein [Nostoc sp. CHAB 5836]
MTKALSWLIKGSTLFCLLPWEPIAAQIVPDATLRVNSSLTIEGNNTSAITGGTQVGSNLFHSFGQFSVPTGSAVYFKNAPDIQNILTRVTGSSISNIDGLIRANGIANVFLINPNGIIFGPNASLDIGGSFFGTTASNIKFADGISFDAKPLSGAESLLTVSVPVGLGFGRNAGNIRVFGDGQGIRKTSDLIDTSSGLRVQPNQTLALVGGDILLSGGTLKTTGGQIELGSVAGAGLVNLIPRDKGWTLRYSSISAFGEIHLSGAAAVDASGNGGGNIQIQARKLMLDGGSQIESSTLGAGTGGTLKINTSDSVNLVGLPEVDSFLNTAISSLVYSRATGSGGNINIETGRLNVRDGAEIAAGTYGLGNASSIHVLAHDSVEVLRKPTAKAGSSITSLAQRGSTGSGGNIKIETARLSLRSGGVISSGTFGQGSGGNVSITADEEVQVTGKSLIGNSPSRISARTGGTGKAGNLTIEAERLTVTDGGRVSIGGEKIPKNLNFQPGQGNAGTLRINADTINLDRGTITAGTESGTKGQGGDISLYSGDLQLRDSIITATAGGNGDGGNIIIDTDIIVAIKNSSITANAFEGQGGNIRIDTKGIFLSPDSKITASSRFGLNGTIQINTLFTNPVQAKAEPEAIRTTPEIASVCQGRSRAVARSKLVVTGTNGLPTSSNDLPASNLNWQSNLVSGEAINNLEEPKSYSSEEPTQIIEAQALIQDSDGNFILTAKQPNTVVPNASLSARSCSQESDVSKILPVTKTTQKDD